MLQNCKSKFILSQPNKSVTTDASTKRWEAHIRMCESSGHVISARDQSHLPSVENSHSHSPNADRQLHKHTLFLQTVRTSGVSTVRRPLNFAYLSLNFTNDLVPASQLKFRPDTASLFPVRSEIYLVTCLTAKENLQLSEVRGSASKTVLPHDHIIWYLHQTDPWITSVFCTMQSHELKPGSTSKSFTPNSPDTSQT